MWRWILIANLVIVLGGLGYGLYDTTNLLHFTQDELNDVKTELADTKAELADTKTELADTKAELADTKTELANTQAELSKFMSTETGQVLDAKTTVDQFFSYAVSSKYLEMWAILHTDSQSEYSDVSDFSSYNNIAPKNGLYLLSSYHIGQGRMLDTWQGYSNVANIKVVAVSDKNIVADLVLGLIPFFGDILTAGPDTQVAVWDAHLVSVNGQWKIFCERSSSAPNRTSTPTPTTPSPSPTTPAPTVIQGLTQLSVHELAINSEKYNGETIWVSGPILSTSASSWSGKALTLQESSGDKLVYCVPYNQDLLSQLKVGQIVTIQGKVEIGTFSEEIRIMNSILVH